MIVPLLKGKLEGSSGNIVRMRLISQLFQQEATREWVYFNAPACLVREPGGNNLGSRLPMTNEVRELSHRQRR